MKLQTIILTVSVLALIVLGIIYFNRPASIANYPSQGTDIIAFGDSLVAGVGSTGGNDFVSLVSKKIGKPIVNLGHSGDTTADGIARLGELDKYNPKVVLLLLGGNDHLKKIPLADTRKNLEVLIQNIQSRGAIVLLLGVRGGLFNDKFDTEFEELRDMYHTAYVSDVLGGLFGNDKYMSDAIHPNDAGYATIAERVSPVLMDVIE
ncbi:MAG: GDSL-type esterase/lipase family protein [Candidatus Paceibacterota bacterium]